VGHGPSSIPGGRLGGKRGVDAPAVSIVILNWNGLGDTIECLNSLKNIAYASYQVVVVDNCSDGDDVEVLKRRFDGYIHVIRNDRNHGCAEGFNTGIRHVLRDCSSDYILLMNNDVVVDAEFLNHLVEMADSDEQIGIVGPKIYYYDYHGRRDVVWSAGGSVRWWAPKIPHQLGHNAVYPAKCDSPVAVDWVSGAVFMFRRHLAEEIGLLDPRYFLGHEDVDYCLRAKEQGYKIVYVPDAMVWHKVGASARKAHITYADPTAYYYFVRQRFPLPIYVYQLLLFPALLSRWAILFLKENRDRHALQTFLEGFIRFVLRGHRRSSYQQQ